ncbi:uncharacterized protein LOC114248324 [Bombyx mandarina]|uniref:Uncharacterized protein LOC114248324 n=1 Tax=Bombyx mandarina TaxID=7092 RepID=A0A6J2K6T2_BOMMA|nr:uncharacterized protein LOC114248324 [Bombyx mandarina]
MSDNNDCDVAAVFLAVLVFALPLTLLIPGFSVWNVVPKFRVTRFHFVSQDVTWLQINAGIITVLTIFFCLYLEIRKRKLDDMVENVLTVSQATDATLEVERGRQAAAVKVCVELLDASTEHYEQLALLRDELQKRNVMKRQYPPAIELSSSEMCA